MADETPSHKPELRTNVSDTAHGTVTRKASKLSAPHLDASVDALGGAPHSSPDHGACSVQSTSKASVHRAAECGRLSAAADSHSSSPNSRTPSESPQQGNPQLGVTALGLGAGVNSGIGDLRSHTSFKNPHFPPDPSCALGHANLTSLSLSRGSTSLKTRMSPALVPVSSASSARAAGEKTMNLFEGPTCKKSGDEDSNPVETAIKAGVIFGKPGLLSGGRGEMIGLDVFPVLPKYEVKWRKSTKPPEDDTEENNAADEDDEVRETTGRTNASEDRGGRGRGSEDRSRDGETNNQPNIDLIHDVVDDLIEEFESQGILKSPSAPPSPRQTSTPDRMTRDESPKRTRSSPLDVAKKRDHLSSPHTERKTIAVRRWASTTLQRPTSPDEASDKQSTPDETSDQEVDLEHVLTACSNLESVTTDVSNEARRFCGSQSNINSERKRLTKLTVHVDEGRDHEAGENLVDRVEPTSQTSGRICKHKSKRLKNVKAMKKRRKHVGATIVKPRSLSKQKKRGNSEKAEESVKVFLVPRRKHAKASRKARKQAEWNNNDDNETPLCTRHGTQRLRKRRTQPLCAHQPSRSKLPHVNGEYVEEQRSKEPAFRHRNTLHLRKSPGRVFSHMKAHKRPAKKDTVDTRSSKRALNTDGYCDTNENRRTARGTPLCRVSSSEVKPEEGTTMCANKLGRAKPPKDVKMKSFTKVSKVGGLDNDVGVSLSDDSGPKRKTRQRFYCDSPKTGKDEGRRKLRSCSKSKVSFVKQDQDGRTVLLSELSSSISENRLEDGTEIHAEGLPLREKCLRFQPLRPADNDEPLYVAGSNRLHSSHSDRRVGHSRDRYIPGEQIRRYYNDVTLRDFGTFVEVESESSVESVHNTLTNVAVPANEQTPTNTRGSTALPRNSSRSLSVDLEWRPGNSSNTGPVNVRCGNRRIARPGSPSAQRRGKHIYPRRDFELPLLTPHNTTPLPLTGTQPAPVIYKHQFETQVYASLSRPPFPVQSPLPQSMITPPVFCEPTALFNEPTFLHSYPWRPPFLAHGTLPALLQEGPSTSKTADVTAAEPDFPHLASPQREQKVTNKETPMSHYSFQATFDAAKHQQSRQSIKAIFPEAAVVTPSALATGPSVSPDSADVGQPEAARLQRPPTHLRFPRAERSRSTLSYHTKPVPPVDINPAPALQRYDVPASAISCGHSCSNSSIYRTSTRPPAFPNEQEIGNHAADAGSTDSIMSSAENRLRIENVKIIFGRGASWALVIVLACLATGIAGGFVIRAKRHQPLVITESEGDSGEQPWLFSPLSNIQAAPTANRSSCQSQLCSEHAGKLFRSLDTNVHPCRNFYGHVCALAAVNGTADEQLAQQTTLRVLSFLKANNSNTDGELPLVVASRRLWNECVQLDTLIRKGKGPLQALLNLTGLGSWPYNDDVSLPDVWKVAGNLQRLMALAPLVELKGLSNGKAQLTSGNLGGSDDVADVLDAMLALHLNGSRLRELAADVAGLNRRLKNLRYRRPTSGSLKLNDTDVLPRSYLETVLTGLLSDVGTVGIQQEPLMGPLVQLVRDSRPQTVLNLLGYRLVRHVDLFTPAAANVDIQSGAVLSRESRCTRAILDDALTSDEAEYVRFAALRDHLNFDSVRFVVAEVKHALDAKLAEQHWLDLRTRRRVQRHLMETKVRFFFDRYQRNSEMKPTDRTLALPSEALATYQRFRESRFRTRVLQGAAYDDEADQDCAYDEHKKMLFLRISAVELRDPHIPLWPALQAARLGPRLSRCMLRVLLPSTTDQNVPAAVRWPPAAHTRLDGLRACLRAQHAQRSNGTSSERGPEQEALAVVDNAALGPARDVFRAYVERLVANDPAVHSTNDAARRSIEWDQTFYLSYAHSMCESPDHGRRFKHHTPHWKTVNYQLSNDEVFQRAFECRAGDPMRVDTTCSFWESSH